MYLSPVLSKFLVRQEVWCEGLNPQSMFISSLERFARLISQCKLRRAQMRPLNRRHLYKDRLPCGTAIYAHQADIETTAQAFSRAVYCFCMFHVQHTEKGAF